MPRPRAWRDGRVAHAAELAPMGEIFRRETAEQPGTLHRRTADSRRRRPGADRALPPLSVRPLAGRRTGCARCRQRRGLRFGAARTGRANRHRRGVVRTDRTHCRRAISPAPICISCRAMRALCRSAMPASMLVVSFETIEHFDRQAEFHARGHRVLRPDGSFIVSTPDRDIYSPADTAANPYHVHELSRAEFAGLLRDTSAHVPLLQQRAMIGSALLPDEAGSPAPPLVFDRRGDTHFEACIGLPRAPYLVAVASNREPPPLPPSLYINSQRSRRPGSIAITTLRTGAGSASTTPGAGGQAQWKNRSRRGRDAGNTRKKLHRTEEKPSASPRTNPREQMQNGNTSRCAVRCAPSCAAICRCSASTCSRQRP